nr:unnamed protein product [Digitaria exilis]
MVAIGCGWSFVWCLPLASNISSLPLQQQLDRRVAAYDGTPIAEEGQGDVDLAASQEEGQRDVDLAAAHEEGRCGRRSHGDMAAAHEDGRGDVDRAAAHEDGRCDVDRAAAHEMGDAMSITRRRMSRAGAALATVHESRGDLQRVIDGI